MKNNCGFSNRIKTSLTLVRQVYVFIFLQQNYLCSIEKQEAEKGQFMYLGKKHLSYHF